MTDITPGDVIEIEVSGRKAYVQMTHRHPSYPPVIRAIEGLHDARPDDLAALAGAPTRFVAMIPLQSALTRAGATFENLSAAEIPEDQRTFPTFRTPIRDKQGEIVYWWFWDGRGLSYDVELDAAASELPLREVMTGQRLLELLAEA